MYLQPAALLMDKGKFYDTRAGDDDIFKLTGVRTNYPSTLEIINGQHTGGPGMDEAYRLVQ